MSEEEEGGLALRKCPGCAKSSVSLTLRELWRSVFGDEEVDDQRDFEGEGGVAVVDEAADYCRACRNIDLKLGMYRYTLLMSMSAPRAFQDYRARRSKRRAFFGWVGSHAGEVANLAGMLWYLL